MVVLGGWVFLMSEVPLYITISNASVHTLCITQLKAQGPSRTCNESKEEEA